MAEGGKQDGAHGVGVHVDPEVGVRGIFVEVEVRCKVVEGPGRDYQNDGYDDPEDVRVEYLVLY